jgi:hypothetical protein
MLHRSPACGDNAQFLVEHHEGVADGIDNGLRERKAVADIDERSCLQWK